MQVTDARKIYHGEFMGENVERDPDHDRGEPVRRARPARAGQAAEQGLRAAGAGRAGRLPREPFRQVLRVRRAGRAPRGAASRGVSVGRDACGAERSRERDAKSRRRSASAATGRSAPGCGEVRCSKRLAHRRRQTPPAPPAAAWLDDERPAGRRALARSTARTLATVRAATPDDVDAVDRRGATRRSRPGGSSPRRSAASSSGGSATSSASARPTSRRSSRSKPARSRRKSLGEVQEMIDVCDFAVGLSRQLYGLTIASERPGHRMMEQWHPLGVGRRDHRVQLPRRRVGVERDARAGLRRPGRLEAEREDAADRASRATTSWRR